MGADIYDWERVHGRGSWDGEPYQEQATKLVRQWRDELTTNPDPMLRRCAQQLAVALGLTTMLAELVKEETQ